MKRVLSPVAAAAVFAGSLSVVSSFASAHENRTVGPYALEVGWSLEPAYINTANAVFVEVVDAHSNAPIEHLDKSIQVEVIVGGAAARRTFDLLPVPQEPGQYHAAFIPTAVGDYAFRVFGMIGSTKVDERFESGPGRFDPVISDSSLQFPKSLTTNDQLAERLDQVRLIAIGALILGIVASIGSIARLLMRRR
ncbi:MAG TPA: hypothetical protein VIP07_12200 [Candidatus Limnocylindria bacterium]